MIFYQLLFIALSFTRAFDAGDLFDLLPDKRGWRRLSKTLKNDKQVPLYVKIYASPFRQLQKASRNDQLGVEQIKSSVLMALHLALESSKSFKVSRKDFYRRDMKDIRSMIQKAITTFDLRKAEKLEPVFTPASLKAFMEQRFEDMFFANVRYSRFKGEKAKFEKKLRSLRSQIKGYRGAELRYLIEIIADIDEIEKRTVKNLIFFRNDIDNVNKKDDYKKAEERVKKLGSSASSSNPISVWLLSCSIVISVSLVFS